ncbi:conserved hypothetical protein [Talaromyces marneffei ATCC 18224]|uniref:HNH nuclease domain-containing protein n=1 Tax=Talaromyces marneffei (strain ATCC 18224 / CBS 334.59 / QM 7333) TaxID=441960 RepID=B6QT67_TALMQ|nr:conserved hypothetical protein [Talaromyces marneffei ATCC 18224]
MANAEAHEPGRAELIKEIADILYWADDFTYSSALWAFLWLSDMSCLEKLKRRLAQDRIINEFCNLTIDVILPWLGKEKTQLSGATTHYGSAVSTPTEPGSRKRRKISGDTRQTAETKFPKDELRVSEQRKLSYVTGAVSSRRLRTGSVLENSHIYPDSMGPLENRQAFWERLELFWPKEKVDQWRRILDTPEGTGSLVNTLTMNTLAHKAWGEALFALKHVKTSAREDKIHLQFYWLKPQKDIPTSLTKDDFLKRPCLPSDECSGEDLLNFHNVKTLQPIRSGDVITMGSYFPSVKPLPSKELIELQWYLHRIVALSAAATEDELKPPEEYYYESDTSDSLYEYS